MKVKELIELLKECDPETEVKHAYANENVEDNYDVEDVIEVRFKTAAERNIVVLRG